MTVRQIEQLLVRMNRRSRAKLTQKLLLRLNNLSDAEHKRLWVEEALERQAKTAGDHGWGDSVAEKLREARAHLNHALRSRSLNLPNWS